MQIDKNVCLLQANECFFSNGHYSGLHAGRAVQGPERHPQSSAIAKNFLLKVEDIRKKFNIRDGGEHAIYFTSPLRG